MSTTAGTPQVLSPGGGLRLQSGPGRDLVFKVSAQAFDYFTVEVAPLGGPPLHVHHEQQETIHVLSGRFRVRIGEDLHTLEPGAFALLPAGVPHAFVNLTDQPAELVVVYVPGGCQGFYEELGPATRSGDDREQIAAIFERHGMSLLGPPLAAD
jgi:quercetin dioxygenase-like cupin family protein